MSILIFFAVLALLILTHELGHFVFAKISGVKVEEFGFGFPPRILGFKKGGTVYSLNLIPFGGFVKIYGEDGEPPTLAESEVGVPTSPTVPSGSVEKDKKSFSGQRLYARALILAAGVFFNLLLAWPVLTTAYIIGTPVSVEGNDISGGTLSNKGVMILQIQENTPAEASGLKEGDYFLRFVSEDGEVLNVSDVKSAQDFITRHAGAEIKIDYLRNRKEFSTKAMPVLNPEPGKGSLGIAMDYVGTIQLPIYRAAWEGLKSTIQLTAIIAKALAGFFYNLFIQKGMLGQITGPVGIAGIVSGAAQTGFVYVLQLIALLSINLALINIIPFPALDGGRLLFLVIEFFKGKPISQKAATVANNTGFAILIILMLFITYRDIVRLFR